MAASGSSTSDDAADLSCSDIATDAGVALEQVSKTILIS